MPDDMDRELKKLMDEEEGTFLLDYFMRVFAELMEPEPPPDTRMEPTT